MPFRALESLTSGSAFPKSSAWESPLLKLKNSFSCRKRAGHVVSLSAPILCFVTDRTRCDDRRLIRRLRSALSAGVDIIQIREKTTPTDELWRFARQVLDLPRQRDQKIILNDRLDIALACGFDGVHLGGTSFPLPVVRRRVPCDFIVGVSIHQVKEAVQAERDGANYVIFGPVFATPSKLKYGPPQGIPELQRVARSLSIPVLAIGGISLANFSDCLEAGAAGIAAISLFQDSPDVKQTLARLRSTHPSLRVVQALEN